MIDRPEEEHAKILAERLKKQFGKKAVSVVNEILKYSPNKPSYVFDPKEYFGKVKDILKNKK